MAGQSQWQFMGNVFVADSVDRGPRVLYDRQTAAAGAALASSIIFYGHSVAANGQHITNLLQANKLPPPEAFLAVGIGWRISSEMLPADWLSIQKSYFWQLVIGRKPVMEGLLDHYPAGAGIHGHASTNHATTALVQSINNGWPGVESMRRFTEYPRIIPAEVNWSMNLNQGGGAAAVTLVASVASTVITPAYGGMDLRCDLDGLFDAPVQ
jgi:hypothetical protein